MLSESFISKHEDVKSLLPDSIEEGATVLSQSGTKRLVMKIVADDKYPGGGIVISKRVDSSGNESYDVMNFSTFSDVGSYSVLPATKDMKPVQEIGGFEVKPEYSEGLMGRIKEGSLVISKTGTTRKVLAKIADPKLPGGGVCIMDDLNRSSLMKISLGEILEKLDHFSVILDPDQVSELVIKINQKINEASQKEWAFDERRLINDISREIFNRDNPQIVEERKAKQNEKDIAAGI